MPAVRVAVAQFLNPIQRVAAYLSNKFAMSGMTCSVKALAPS